MRLKHLLCSCHGQEYGYGGYSWIIMAWPNHSMCHSLIASAHSRPRLEPHPFTTRYLVVELHSQRLLGLAVAMSFLCFNWLKSKLKRPFELDQFHMSSHKAACEKKGFMALVKEISMESLMQVWHDTLRSFGKGLWACDLCFQDLDNLKIKLKYGFTKDYQGQRLQAWESLHLQSWIQWRKAVPWYEES